MLKTSPSKIGLVLDMKTKDLEEVVYFISHVVINSGGHDGKLKSGLREKEVLDQQLGRERLLHSLKHVCKQAKDEKHVIEPIFLAEIDRYMEILNQKELPYSFTEISGLIALLTGTVFGIGADAIHTLLKNVDLNKEIVKTRVALQTAGALAPKLSKRLQILDCFVKSGNKPE